MDNILRAKLFSLAIFTFSALSEALCKLPFFVLTINSNKWCAFAIFSLSKWSIGHRSVVNKQIFFEVVGKKIRQVAKKVQFALH